MLQSINPVCTQLHTDNGKTSLHHVEIALVSSIIYTAGHARVTDVLTVGNTVNTMKQNCSSEKAINI